MFNIKGTLYFIYDGDNSEYYLLHRYDRMNPVRIPKDIANKYLIRDYVAITDLDYLSIYKGDKLTLISIDDDGEYYFKLLKNGEGIYFNVIDDYLEHALEGY